MAGLYSQGSTGQLKPPCAKCVREGADCILAGSRRGGDFSRFRNSHQHISEKSRRVARQPARLVGDDNGDGRPQHSPADNPVHDSLQNPSDALLILAHAAGENVEFSRPDSACRAVENTTPPAPESQSRFAGISNPNRPNSTTLNDYPLIQDGTLDPILLIQLLHR